MNNITFATKVDVCAKYIKLLDAIMKYLIITIFKKG